jgi:tetratricopeptide (TPR) repeat protein
MWNAAVEDLSAAIHLNPDNSVAFYYRGCILRKSHPNRALQDFSVSLLIDDTDDNVLAFLHRGILYNEMGRPDDAIPDFESVLKLNKDNACAHNNLGLIYYQMENYHTAIKRFSSAIKVDPTYIRSYVCRGEAYFKIHELKSALLDFTRAIHLKPDVVHYYMYRGFLLLKMGNLDLAAFCVRHAAKLSSTQVHQSSAMSQSATQQAMVQAFLKNYDKAIETFVMATKQKPRAPLFILLGKMQMKAKVFKDAIESFEKALELLKPWGNRLRIPWPKEAAEVHHLIGMCYSEMRNYLSAHDAFNNSLKIDAKYADVSPFVKY